jgi:hypothetical protein
MPENNMEVTSPAATTPPTTDHNVPTPTPNNFSPPSRPNIYFVSSLATGISTTVIMNPYDRGLYLSVKDKRDFLSRANFTSPYQGCGQALFQRTVFGSIYYIMQGELREHMHPVVRDHLMKSAYTAPFSEPLAHFSIGLTAGSAYGVVTNFMSAIKYYTWGDDTRGFFKSATEMVEKGGLEPLLKGTLATVSREIVYSSTYEVLRFLLQQQFVKKSQEAPTHTLNIFNAETMCNTVAAGAGAVASSPWNFARNMQYASKVEEAAPKIRTILVKLWHDSSPHVGKGFGRAGFFVDTLKIGWGTLGTAVRMSIGQFAFDTTKKSLSPPNEVIANKTAPRGRI